MKGKKYRCVSCRRLFTVRIDTYLPIKCPFCRSTAVVNEPKKKPITELPEKLEKFFGDNTGGYDSHNR